MNPHALMTSQPLPPIVTREARYAADTAQATTPLASPLRTEERLPFRVRVVSDAEALDKAVRIRHSAYARHVPDLARTLQLPEQADFSPGSVVLLAESNLDGSPLGTMRIQTNRYAPLALEQSLALPESLQGAFLAEATRLGVVGEKVGTLVKTVLFKAFFLYCQQAGVDWMVITGRAPIDRQYQRLLFDDVYPDLGYIPIKHVGNLPHRVMKFEVATAEERWTAANHPLFNFIFRTHHPDIQLSEARESRSGLWSTAAVRAGAAAMAM